MLDGLDDIDWARLGHAYGTAADVPDQLRALRSDRPEARSKALNQLYGNIYHQGTRYEATAYAVPFLLELLADRDTADRVKLLVLLSAITTGYDEYYLPDTVPIADHRRTAAGGDALLAAQPRPGDEPAEEDDEDGEWEDDDGQAAYEYLESLSEEDQNRLLGYVAVAAYDAVRAGVPLFRSLLTEDDEKLRIFAAYALAWFPEEAGESVSALAGLAARSTGPEDAAVAATAVVAMGLLGGEPPAGGLTDERPLVRWAAAIAHACTKRPDTPEAAVTELLTWAGGTTEADDDIPFLGGDLAGYAALALEQLWPEHGDATFDALLARIPEVSGLAALPVVGVALRRAFPSGRVPEGTPFSALDEPQRRLVRALADSPGTWLYGTSTFGNFVLLIGSYRLPSKHDALQAYVAAS